MAPRSNLPAFVLTAAAYLASAVMITAVVPTACASARLTPYSAGELAARLANEECQARYGARPFAGEDFEAVLTGGRWVWSSEERSGVDGYSVTVSFDQDGGRKNVAVDRGEDRGNPDGL